ncbi:hypothetical protein BDR26DRAFT_865132 [Obelidium mucronatum]|nr:hypothetical protein BDR26DRAFT_865132 [Obelidium mucronatum]
MELKENDWCFQPLTSIRLPEIFTPDEWETIRKFNYKTSVQIHDGNIPSLSNGRPYIVIQNSEFTQEMISVLKRIGVKAALFFPIQMFWKSKTRLFYQKVFFKEKINSICS